MKPKTRRTPKRVPVGITRRLEHSLSRLVQDELIRAQSGDERMYSFKHALTQDAAESTLLHGAHKRLHRSVAQAYETVYADRCMDEFAAALAQHYYSAGDDAKMFQYALRAGEQAMQVYALDEASTYYALAAGVAREQGTSAEVQRLYTRRGRALELQDDYDRALANYQEMDRVGRARGDRTLELWSFILPATLNATLTPVYNLERARELSERALPLAHELSDRAAEAKIFWNLLLVETNTRDLTRAVEYGEQSRALARELGLKEQWAFTDTDLGRVYLIVGDLDTSRARMEEGRALWRELGNEVMLSDNLMMSGTLALQRGELDETVAFAGEGREIGRRLGNQQAEYSNAGTLLGALAARGEYASSIEIALYLLARGQQDTARRGVPLAPSICALLFAQVGEFGRARELADNSVQLLATPMPPLFRGWSAGNVARTFLRIGDLQAAELAIAQADAPQARGFEPRDTQPILARAEVALAKGEIEAVERTMREFAANLRAVRAHLILPDALYLHAQALCELGESRAAKDALEKARELAAAMQLRPILWQILAALSEIATESGDVRAADEFRQQARAVIAEIVERMPPEYRASFLALPAVRALETA